MAEIEELSEIQHLLDELTYRNVVYNVEQCGVSWEDIVKLFPQSGEAMRNRYEATESDVAQICRDSGGC